MEWVTSGKFRCVSMDERGKAGRPPGEDKEAVTVRLPVDLMERIRKLAEDNRRLLSAEIQVALEAHLRQEAALPA